MSPPLVCDTDILAWPEGEIGIHLIDAWLTGKEFKQLGPCIRRGGRGHEYTAAADSHVDPALPHAEHVAVSVGVEPRHNLVGRYGGMHGGRETLAGRLRRQTAKHTENGKSDGERKVAGPAML